SSRWPRSTSRPWGTRRRSPPPQPRPPAGWSRSRHDPAADRGREGGGRRHHVRRHRPGLRHHQPGHLARPRRRLASADGAVARARARRRRPRPGLRDGRPLPGALGAGAQAGRHRPVGRDARRGPHIGAAGAGRCPRPALPLRRLRRCRVRLRPAQLRRPRPGAGRMRPGPAARRPARAAGGRRPVAASPPARAPAVVRPGRAVRRRRRGGPLRRPPGPGRRRLPLSARLRGLPAPDTGAARPDLFRRLHLCRTAPAVRRHRPAPLREAVVTASPGVADRLATLVSRARALAPGEVDDLLDVLGPDGFAWLRGGSGFVTAGVAARIPVDGPSPMAGAGPGGGPVAVGALPFDDRRPWSLVAPAVVVVRRPDGTGWVTTTTAAATAADDVGGVNGHPAAVEPGFAVALTEAPGRAVWTESVRRILSAIDTGDVRKVVLARQLIVQAGAAFDRRTVLDRLRRSHPSCFTYAVGGFVGASPELLVRRRGEEVASCPMAGSVRRGATPEEDEALTAGLRRSVKEAEEHRLLVDAVVAALAPVCAGRPAAGEPEVVRFPTVSHLATRVSGVLRRPAPSALALAGLLHPTPAVGGLPRAAALATIAALEGFDRGLYAGPVGWVDAAGDGEWAVALRGAQLDGRRARLVAGAGIVAGSDPDAEWAETEV